MKKRFLLIIPVLLIIILLIIPDPNTIINNSEYSETKIIQVKVFGEVEKVGTYNLSEGSTMEDLLRKCKLTDYSDISCVNVNEELVDNAVYEITIVKNNSKGVVVHVIKSNVIPVYNTSDTVLIDINEAEFEVLIGLPGIGSVKANSIINYREIKLFESIDEIKEVEGISDSIYDKIKNLITV